MAASSLSVSALPRSSNFASQTSRIRESRVPCALRLVLRSPLSSRCSLTVATAAAAASGSAPSSAELVLVDHYARLGVPRTADNAEIARAFEQRCKQVAEDPKLDEEQARQRVQALEASFAVLTSEEQRRLYDWAVVRAESDAADSSPAPYVWPFEADLTQVSPQANVGKPPRPMVAEDEEGINQLGLVFVGWLVLSAVLSLTLH